MIAINYTNFRENMKENFDRITDDYDWLMESKAQLEKGRISPQELTEVSEDE